MCEKEKKILDQIGCTYAFVAYSLSKAFLESLKDKEFVRVSLKTMSKILSEHINNDEILQSPSEKLCWKIRTTSLDSLEQMVSRHSWSR